MNTWCCMNQTEREQVEAAMMAQRIVAIAKTSRGIGDAKNEAQRRVQEPSTKLEK